MVQRYSHFRQERAIDATPRMLAAPPRRVPAANPSADPGEPAKCLSRQINSSLAAAMLYTSAHR